MPTNKLLTVRERADIRKRAKGNKDVEDLLTESDELRRLLENGSRANRTLQEALDRERKDHKQTASKLKKAEARLKKAQT